MIPRVLLSGLIAASFAADVYAANEPLETIEVRGSLAEVRQQVQTFVTEVTRKEGELIGRWDTRICPMIVGVADDQAAFIRHRLFEVDAEARKRKPDETRACKPNLFVIITPEPEQVLEDWKARDPTMFRWKSPEWVTRSSGDGPVRTWHNATEIATGAGFSRIEGKYSEFINNVVVLVDARRTTGKSLAQIADYIALVSLSQIDSSANVEGVQSILQLFLPTAQSIPTALTEWDLALLHGLYRTSYTPAHQRMDLMARMSRELAPRSRSASESRPGAPAVAAISNDTPAAKAVRIDGREAATASIETPPVVTRGIDPTKVKAATNGTLETVVVQGSRAEVRKQIEVFVAQVTRKDGELIGRWRDSICPRIAGLTDAQGEFVRGRLLDVEAKVRKRRAQPDRKCNPNLFVMITDDTDSVLTGWKERDPTLFRWKTPPDVSRSDDAGPVRIWHNAIMLRSDDGPWVMDPTKSTRAPSGRLRDSRIQASAKEAITAVVVLVDAKKMGKVTLDQMADYLAMVSLSQIDLRADLGATNTILKLFADPETGARPSALTEWDYAFLNGLYRSGYYSPMNQRMDISARMSRELAPRK